MMIYNSTVQVRLGHNCRIGIHLILALCVTLSSNALLVCARPIMGDSTIAGQSFSFPLAKHAFNRNDGVFYVGALEKTVGEAAKFAVAVANESGDKFFPVATAEKTVINGVADQVNPLFGAQISQLGLLGVAPVIVTQDLPNNVYLIPQIATDLSLLGISNIQDSAGLVANGIVGLTTYALLSDVGVLRGGLIFAAVQKNGGLFGQPGGSGVAAIGYAQEPDTKKFALKSLGATTALDTTSEAVKITSDLASMAPVVAMHTDSTIAEFYVGLQVQGGAGVTDGAQAVVRSNTAGLPLFHNLIPNSAVTADSIIAAVGSSVFVTMYNLGAMLTSTRLQYLIVQGGVGDPNVIPLKRKVFALPQLSANGALAKKDAIPVDTFSPDYPFGLVSRALVTEPLIPGDLYTSSDVPAIVGGADAPGDITELFVDNDSVFVSTAANAAGLVAGIFYSQALFDELGRIKGWTAWQRVGGVAQPVWGFALDDRLGNFWFMTGPTVDSVKTVERTLWQKDQGVGAVFAPFFSQEQGGIQGLFDFPQITPSFDQGGDQLAVTIATGYQRVVIAQTGSMIGGFFGPVTNYSNNFTSTNGTLAGFSPGVQTIAFAGGVIQELGAIVAATIVTDGTYGWLVVAGTGGVAVLAQDDGAGWPLDLKSGFVGLSSQMKWKRVGNFSLVRKLIAGEDSLYILGQQTLMRIPVSAALFSGAVPVAPVVLAQAGQLPGGVHAYFSDAIISQKFGILATSSGVVRVGNGSDITTAQNAQAIGWVVVTLNESTGPVSRLLAISPTGIENQVVQDSGVDGNIYMLNAYVGYHQARVYRFTLDYSGTITETTLQQFPDYIVKGKKTFFLTFGDYRNFITTDGAIFAASRSRYIDSSLFLEFLAQTWKRGMSVDAIRRARKVIVDVECAHRIGQMIRSSASGSWLVPGDFGLFVNE